MATWKMPPKVKVYEALSTVADERVNITGPTTAKVISSSHDKTYDIIWSEDMRKITSNDNASYWQGYIGYPIIAVLLKLGKLPFNAHVAKLLAGVPWKELNDKFKRDYEKAIKYVLEKLEAKGANPKEIVQEVERIYELLPTLELQRAPRGRPPSKAKQQ